MEISQRPGCYVWNPLPQTDETVTWTGGCDGGFAHGTGTLTWAVSGSEQQTEIGRFTAGRRNGHWVVREANGDSVEGPIVNGKWNGRWVLRRADGSVEEHLYADGEHVRRVR